MSDSIGARFVACKAWRWMPGMLVNSAGRIYRMTAESIADGCGAADWQRVWMRPDTTDPATIGCILALVRDAWGDPNAYLGWFDPHWKVIGNNPGGGCLLGRGATEAEALLAALESAP